MANLLETLQTGIDNPVSKVSVLTFSYHLVLASICALILEQFYIRYGTSLSNRQKLARNFLLITATTTLVITIVKSSLALSLGLVGALSIVRFRTAVKEPEELAFLFLSISLGLGFGANQTLATLVAFALILVVLYLHRLNTAKINPEPLLLNLVTKKTKNISINKIIKQLVPYCSQINLKRVDDQKQSLDVSLHAEFKDINSVNKALMKLKKQYPQAEITILDQSGIAI